MLKSKTFFMNHNCKYNAVEGPEIMRHLAKLQEQSSGQVLHRNYDHHTCSNKLKIIMSQLNDTKSSVAPLRLKASLYNQFIQAQFSKS